VAQQKAAAGGQSATPPPPGDGQKEQPVDVDYKVVDDKK